ncbi:putative nicotinate-nucleotide adenylyltransferase [Desulfovibrionales bacterium]
MISHLPTPSDQSELALSIPDLKGPSIGLLGGSFNPIHCGHIQLAMTAALAIDRLDLVPCGLPPHKSKAELLPFSLRLELVALAVADFDKSDRRICVNDLEGSRPGPSYTIDTLTSYRAAEPKAALFFFLGASDLFTLTQWRSGLILPRLATFVAVSRQDIGAWHIAAFVAACWPKAVPLSLTSPPMSPFNSCGWYLPPTEELPAAELLFLPLASLNCSSSKVREAWRTGQDFASFLHPTVTRRLLQRRTEVEAFWGPRP